MQMTLRREREITSDHVRTHARTDTHTVQGKTPRAYAGVACLAKFGCIFRKE